MKLELSEIKDAGDIENERVVIREGNRTLTFLLIGVCALGAVGTWIDGAGEHAEQRAIQGGLYDIQKTLKSPSQAPEQILAAAASKIISQGNEIASLKSAVNTLQHPPRRNKR